MDQHINYITLGVTDLAASRRFYQEVFGWQETAESNEHIAFFQADSALLLALYPKDALAHDARVADACGSGFPRFTLAHNVGSPAEVDALFAALAEKRRASSSHRRRFSGVDTVAMSPILTAFCGKLPTTPFWKNCAEHFTQADFSPGLPMPVLCTLRLPAPWAWMPKICPTRPRIRECPLTWLFPGRKGDRLGLPVRCTCSLYPFLPSSFTALALIRFSRKSQMVVASAILPAACSPSWTCYHSITTH